MSDEVERTLCQLPSCHVIKIPVRKTSEGYRAADWPKDPIWTGRLKIVAKGKLATVFLLDSKNVVFASCPVADDAAVERVTDSGRYFVLRIQSADGKRAFIGLAFNERNDAFEFNVALQEFKAELERENQPIAAPTSFKDLSLKEGEKIKINFGSGKANSSRKEGGGSGILAPPPGTAPRTIAPLPMPGKLAAPAPAPAPSADPFGSAFTSSSDPFATSTTASADPFAASTSTTNNSSSVFGFAPTAAPKATSDPFGASTGDDPFASTPFGSDPFASPPVSTPTAGSTNLLDM